MKKLVLFIFIFLLTCSLIYAADFTSNVYQISTYVDITTQPEKAITFPYPTRNLYIINGDASDDFWVSLDNITSEYDNCALGTENCVVIPKSDSIELINFATNGITLVGRFAEASPITVIATY